MRVGPEYEVLEVYEQGDTIIYYDLNEDQHVEVRNEQDDTG